MINDGIFYWYDIFEAYRIELEIFELYKDLLDEMRMNGITIL